MSLRSYILAQQSEDEMDIKVVEYQSMLRF
eukprot:COSAG01_NODE_26271_length_719_cov_1.016129_3_plen_30_part_01